MIGATPGIYYVKRWAVELVFKDGKQTFYSGKEQSETLDAVVASCNLAMIRYLLLVFIFHKYQRTMPLGSLFRAMTEIHLRLVMMESMWGSEKS